MELVIFGSLLLLLPVSVTLVTAVETQTKLWRTSSGVISVCDARTRDRNVVPTAVNKYRALRLYFITGERSGKCLGKICLVQFWMFTVLTSSQTACDFLRKPIAVVRYFVDTTRRRTRIIISVSRLLLIFQRA